MNIKKSLVALAVGVCGLSMSAQTATETTVYDFQPTWYVQGQVGAQETLGEGPFGKLLSPNANIAVGRQLTPIWGLRLGIGSWMSKGTIKTDDLGRQNWKYKYIAPAVDVTMNITNGIWGFNPERLVDWNIFAGIGLNVAWGNDEANDVNKALVAADMPGLQYVWDGTKCRLLGRLGTAVDFNVAPQWKVGLEFNANFLNDHYNSKKAGNADWYFNLLASVKYTFGEGYTKRVVKNEPIVIEKIVEVPVEVIKEVEVTRAVEEVEPEGPMERNVFFAINSSVITVEEMQKVRDVAEYLRANPEAKCSVTGYADKNTGTLAINLRLAKQRSQAVAKALTQNYGISKDRLIVSSMKNQDYQPFPNDTPDYVLNRVAICICE